MTAPSGLRELFGDGYTSILRRLEGNGYLSDDFQSYYHLTPLGRSYYQHLRKKRMWDGWKEVAFWMIFGATIWTLVYAIYDHSGCSGSPANQEEKESQLSQPTQPLADTSEPAKPTTDILATDSLACN